MTIFHKMHGLGNDFVVLDLRQQSFQIDSQVATQLADRQHGIGCDQILVLRNAEQPHQQAAFEIWNSNGSRAEQCGNGVRCLGLFLHRQNETTNGRATLAGPTGEVDLQCLDDTMVQADMGKPVFAAEMIPLQAQDNNGWYQIHTDQGELQIGAVSIGNPHALMLVDDLEHTDISKLGPTISRHNAFPAGCNAGFCEIINPDEIQLRVYERGAAETMACGSGACAAMVILKQAGLVSDTVRVTQAGGMLTIKWTGGEEPVKMKGPAAYVFKGTFYE